MTESRVSKNAGMFSVFMQLAQQQTIAGKY